MAITKEQIIQTAEELESEGVNITMNAVRERLKGGSFATISPVLREWKRSREKTAQTALEMPSELNGAIQRAGAEIWSVASALASAKLEAVQIEAQALVDEAQSERDEALKEIENLEGAIDFRLEDIARLNTELESKIINVQELEEYKIKIEKELFTERAAAKATIDGLEARLQDAKEAMDKLAKVSETPKKRTYRKKPEQTDIEDQSK
jgi:hypothetical protein